MLAVAVSDPDSSAYASIGNAQTVINSTTGSLFARVFISVPLRTLLQAVFAPNTASTGKTRYPTTMRVPRVRCMCAGARLGNFFLRQSFDTRNDANGSTAAKGDFCVRTSPNRPPNARAIRSIRLLQNLPTVALLNGVKRRAITASGARLPPVYSYYQLASMIP